MAAPKVTMGDIYRGIVPFVLIEAVAIATIAIFPQIVIFSPFTAG